MAEATTAANSMVVSKSPAIDPPRVIFKEFGDSALIFELRCFITDIDYHWRVVSEINFAIAAAFSKVGIEIPFPQSDLHLKSSEVDTTLRNK